MTEYILDELKERRIELYTAYWQARRSHIESMIVHKQARLCLLKDLVQTGFPTNQSNQGTYENTIQMEEERLLELQKQRFESQPEDVW